MTLLESVKDVLLLDKIVSKLHGLRNLIPGFVKDFYSEYRLLCFFVAIAGLVLLAFEGYKLFKLGLYVATAVFCAAGGYLYVAPLVQDYTKDMIPDIVNTKILVAFICALVAVFLTRFAYKFVILCIGGGFGFLFGYIYVWRVLINYFNTLEFLKQDMSKYIIGGVFAAIFGILFLLLFKHAFMVGSSFGCMIFAAILLRKILVPGGDDNVKICFVVAGAIIGIFAVIHQYREEERSQELVF